MNLSHNFFIWKIPENMRAIESLDFSTNQIFGKIPHNFSSLLFLNHSNLSNNNFAWNILLSTQLQSFGTSSFADNDLCEAPHPNCIEKNVLVRDNENGKGNEDEDKDKDGIDRLLYVSMALGFVVGFWCFIGSLFINGRWRYKYCYFLHGLGDKFGCFARKCY